MHMIPLLEDENTSTDFHSIAKLWAQEYHYSSELSSFGTEEVLNLCLEAQSWSCEIHPSLSIASRGRISWLNAKSWGLYESRTWEVMSNIRTLWPLRRICKPTTFQQTPQMFAKIWRKLWPSWENQIVPFEHIPSKAVSIVSWQSTMELSFVWMSGVIFQGLQHFWCPPESCASALTYFSYSPYHDAKEEIWRYHFCQSFIIFIGYHCPAFVNKDIQCLEISVEPSPCIQFLHYSCDGQHNVQFEEIIWGITWQSQWNFFNPLSPKLLMLQSTFIKSIKSLCHEQFNWGSSGQLFTTVMMRSKLSTCNLQCFKVVSTPED